MKQLFRKIAKAGLLTAAVGCPTSAVIFGAELQTGYAEKIAAHLAIHATDIHGNPITPEFIEQNLDSLYHGIDTSSYNIIVHAKAGEVIGEQYNLSDRITLDDLTPQLQWAFPAAEDKRFYDHHGWDMAAIIAPFQKLFTGNTRGYSTISVQIADQLYLNNEYEKKYPQSSLKRIWQLKRDEWLTAAVLEQYKSKDEILVEYMNVTTFGYSSRDGKEIIGVDAAAEYYFGKEPKELDYLEAAMLAGMLQSPTRYGVKAYEAFVYDKTPDSSYVAELGKKTRYVLAKMYELNFGRDESVIPEREYYKALERVDKKEFPFKENTRMKVIPEAYGFTKSVLARVPAILEHIGQATPEGEDIHVYTGLDLELQRHIQQLVDKQCETLDKTLYTKHEKRKGFKDNSFNGAAVVLNSETHEIAALVDGRSVYEQTCYQSCPVENTSSKKTEVKCGNALPKGCSLEQHTERIYNKANRAAVAFWHSGSSIKGIIDMIAFENGYLPSTTIRDEKREYKTAFGMYSPSNFDGAPSGNNYTLEEATIRSVNNIFVELLYQLYKSLGEKQLLGSFHRFGIPLEHYEPSAGIGAFEASLVQISGAYAVIPENGMATPYTFSSANGEVYENINAKYITYLEVGDIQIILEGTPSRVVSEATVSAIDTILREVVSPDNDGTGRGADVPGLHVRGKTGTAMANVVFVGYEPSLDIVATVAFGLEHPNKHLSEKYTGGKYAAPIAKEIFLYTKQHM